MTMAINIKQVFYFNWSGLEAFKKDMEGIFNTEKSHLNGMFSWLILFIKLTIATRITLIINLDMTQKY